jgi:uncharacterized membrane protein HdeD (DUF308 family)
MEKQMRTHRVGSITAGICLIVFGSLFLLSVFTDVLSYACILKLWPLALIGIGVELLVSNCSNRKFVYDKAAVALLFLLLIFAACMAGADMCITYLGQELR